MTPEGRVQLTISLGAASAGIAVLLGAFAAHGLRGTVDARALEVFETGARYQMYHSLGAMLAGLLQSRFSRISSLPALLFLAGTVLFSGSLYALALSGIRQFGIITPLGGIAFVAGWTALAWQARRSTIDTTSQGSP